MLNFGAIRGEPLQPPVDFLDDFDPRTWDFDEQPDDVVHLHLSQRIDCYCILDRQDYEWAKAWLWCHTFGSGDISPLKKAIARPDHIYARRAVELRGKNHPLGRRCINVWLHREVCTRAYGPMPAPRMVGDHLNGNTLDNRRRNLRWATLSQNARNLFGSAWLQQRLEGI